MKVVYWFIFLFFVTPIFVQGNEKGQKNIVIGAVIRDVKDVIADLNSTLGNLEIHDSYKIAVRDIRNKIYVSEGICIISVEDNSLAETVGLNILDVVVDINGNKVDSLFSFNERLNQSLVGDTLEITVNRNGVEKIIHLVMTSGHNSHTCTSNMETEVTNEALKKEDSTTYTSDIETKVVNEALKKEDSTTYTSDAETKTANEALKKEDNPSKHNKETSLAKTIQCSYDEFTGEVLMIAETNGPISFVKSISETGKSFIILKWDSSVRGKPESKRLQLIILFEDNSRLSISLPIVYKYDEFWSSFYLTMAIGTEIAMDSTVYRLSSEVLLSPLQIETFKNKTIKKYRLEGYESREINDKDPDSKIIFNKLLETKYY